MVFDTVQENLCLFKCSYIPRCLKSFLKSVHNFICIIQKLPTQMYCANTSAIQLLSWNTSQIQMFCTRWSYKMLVHLIASKTIQLVQLIQIHEQNTNTNKGTNYTPHYPLIPCHLSLYMWKHVDTTYTKLVQNQCQYSDPTSCPNTFSRLHKSNVFREGNHIRNRAK